MQLGSLGSRAMHSPSLTHSIKRCLEGYVKLLRGKISPSTVPYILVLYSMLPLQSPVPGSQTGSLGGQSLLEVHATIKIFLLVCLQLSIQKFLNLLKLVI